MTSDFSIESSTVVHEGAVVNTEVVSLRAPSGELLERQVVRHPGAVAVVAIDDGDVVLVKQYRVAVDDELLEIPAGKLDIAGEPPADAARRELIEEVGLDPTELIELGSFVTAAGFSDERIWIFASTEHTDVGRQVDGVEEAHSTVLRVPVGEIMDWTADGRLEDSKTLVGLLWAQQRGLLG